MRIADSAHAAARSSSSTRVALPKKAPFPDATCKGANREVVLAGTVTERPDRECISEARRSVFFSVHVLETEAAATPKMANDVR
jgi:hypothetical protein